MNSRPTILVADDDADIVAMLDLRLSSQGYDVVSAMDGDTALAQARAHQPRVMLLDVMMPRRTGWEVAKTLKGDAATRDIKIIMLSAIGSTVNDATSPLYGADAHMDKPFDFDRLESLIASMV